MDKVDDATGDLNAALGIVRTPYMDAEKGRAALECKAEMRMCHSGGVVQGGFVTGWIDAAMARAVMAATDFAVLPMRLKSRSASSVPPRPAFTSPKPGSSGAGVPPPLSKARCAMRRAKCLPRAPSTIRSAAARSRALIAHRICRCAAAISAIIGDHPCALFP